MPSPQELQVTVLPEPSMPGLFTIYAKLDAVAERRMGPYRASQIGDAFEDLVSLWWAGRPS